MRMEYQEEPRLFLSIECLDNNYEDFRIAIFKLRVRIAIFKLRVKYCMREYSCRG